MHKALTVKYGLVHCLGIRNHYSKPKQTRMTLWLYLVFMIVSFLLLELTAYPALRKGPSDTDRIELTTQSLFGLTMVLWLIVWQKDPGYLKKDETMKL